MKKGQGLSMNVIIIAAISLLVLVIISFLVIKTGNQVTDGTGCEGIQGVCVGSNFDNCADYAYTYGGTYIAKDASCGEDEFCCVKVGSN